MKPTRVKFIKFQGDIIALFPDELYNERLYGKTKIMSYMHMGQHSSASNSLMKLRYATPEDYTPLLKELKRIGYYLDVMKSKNERNLDAICEFLINKTQELK